MLDKMMRHVKNMIKYAKSGGVVYINFSKVQPSKRFEGKRVLITGGSSGIGLETAKEYLAEGAEVIITGRHGKTLEEAARKLASDKLHTVIWDVSDVKIISEKLQESVQLLNGSNIDIFVNNAGIYVSENLAEYDESTYDSIMATNTKGLFFMCQAEKNYFIKNGIKGRIVNICSSRGIIAGCDPYSISKWGAMCITKGLAKDVVKYGIIVNGIAPGVVLTNISDWSRKQNIEDNAFTPSHLTGRYTLVEEFAGIILYLSSDLGSNIVGQVIPVDGGWTLK